LLGRKNNVLTNFTFPKVVEAEEMDRNRPEIRKSG
jgi:hypothetical protein